MRGTQVWSLVQEDPTCCGATKPVCRNYWACALEPASHNCWACMPQLLKPTHPRACALQLLSPHTTTTEAHAPRVGAPQQQNPLQWEARAPQWRVAPPRTATRESPRAAKKKEREKEREGGRKEGRKEEERKGRKEGRKEGAYLFKKKKTIFGLFRWYNLSLVWSWQRSQNIYWLWCFLKNDILI